MTAAIIDALESLLRRGDTEGVLSLLLRLTTKPRTAQRSPGEQLPLPLEVAKTKTAKADDSLFATVMNNWDALKDAALRKKRQREAEAEEHRAQLRKARATPSTTQIIAAMVARGGTPGRIMQLALAQTEISIADIHARLGGQKNRIYVALHSLETKSFLSRVRPGVYVAKSLEGATSERCGKADREAKTLR